MLSRDHVPYAVYFIVLLLFSATLFFVPYLESQDKDSGRALFSLYKPMCHQLPSRSFFVFGQQMPVCARDFGIYGGMLLGAVAFLLVYGARSSKLLPIWIFIAAMIPIGIDGGIQFVSGYYPLPVIGQYESNNALRLITGLIMGIVMSFFAIPLLNGVWQDLMKKKN
jgi:uncharacterized membrane protein